MTVKTQIETVKNGVKYQAIKAHIDRNKQGYIGFGLGVLITLALRKPTHIINTVSPYIEVKR